MKPQPTGHCQCDSLEVNRHLLSVEQAQALATKMVSVPTGQELVSLADALSRIAAKDLHAPKPMPFFDNSAMDGYAVRTTDLSGQGPFCLSVTGESAAGGAGLRAPDQHAAIRIYTGAPVPEGFDAVIAQENCLTGQGKIEFNSMPASGMNIRYQGSDMKRGACLIKKGTRIAPHHVGLLAANGYSAVNVHAKPKVAVFSTGDELAKPGQPLKPGQIYDCNKPMLIALFAAMGIDAVDLGSIGDEPVATQAFLTEQKNAYDLTVSTGSVSVGDRDFLKPAFREAGGTISSWKVAIKPGKPIMFGELGRSIFTALPGNPFAVFVGFNLFVRPQITRICGQIETTPKWLNARADFVWKRKPGRTEVFPVKLNHESDSSVGKMVRLGNSVSATLYPLAEADGLAMVPPDRDEINPDDMVQWQPFC